MYWREEPKQTSLDSERRRVCPVCRTLDPPTEPAYGCPECGYGATLSQLGGEIPEVCPSCDEGKLELITEHACAECGEGEVEEREVYPCPHCGHIRLSKYDYHPCPNRPRQSEGIKSYREGDWTPGGKGKVAYLRLECRAKEERVKVGGRFCPGWRKVVERFHGGDNNAFMNCISCAMFSRINPGKVEATGTDPWVYQTAIRL